MDAKSKGKSGCNALVVKGKGKGGCCAFIVKGKGKGGCVAIPFGVPDGYQEYQEVMTMLLCLATYGEGV